MALPGFAAPATLAIHADEKESQAGGPPLIGRYDEASQSWQLLATAWDEESRTTSLRLMTMGFYALLAGGEAAEMRLYLSGIWN